MSLAQAFYVGGLWGIFVVIVSMYYLDNNE